MNKQHVMRTKSFVVILVMAVIVAGWATCGYCAKIKNFSAEQVSIDPSGKVQGTGKIYMTPQKIRMEFRSPQGEGTMVNVFRRDSNIHWMINPEAKKYMERPLDEAEMQKALKQHMAQDEKILGTETVNGFKCTKKSVVTTVKFFGISRKSESIIWVSKRLDLPIKTQSKEGHITELRNIKTGRQPAKLFTVPPGYQKVANMIELFGDKPPSGEKGTGSDEGEKKGSFFDNLPKNIKDKLPTGMKWPFGGDKEADKGADKQ
jgi:outer membrane lipoprotein-sorting protein